METMQYQRKVMSMHNFLSFHLRTHVKNLGFVLHHDSKHLKTFLVVRIRDELLASPSRSIVSKRRIPKISYSFFFFLQVCVHVKLSLNCLVLGNLSTRRSWYHGRQPEVFLQHDSHCACQDVLGLQSRISKREFSG